MTCSSTGCSAVPSWTMPVSAAAIASAGVAVRTTRLRALRAMAGSMTVQLPRSRRSGAALRGQLVHLLVGERVAVHRELPAEAEELALAEDAGAELGLALRHRPGPVEHRARGQLTAQAPRPQHVDPPGRQGGDAVLEQALELVAVERDLVGDPQLEQPVEHGPGLRRPAQRDRGMGPRPVAEAVLGLGLVGGPQHRGVAEVQGVLLVVDLEHQSHRPGDQLLLVGLHPQRDPYQLGQLGPRLGVAPEPFAQPVLELRSRHRGVPLGRRRGSRHGVGDRVEDGADDVLGLVGREPVVRPGRRQAHDSVFVVGRQRPHPPARLAAGRLDLPGRDQPQPEQGGPGQQPHAGVQVVAAVRLREHRQRGPDRQRDGAPFVGELDDPVARRLGGAEDRRAGDRDETHTLKLAGHADSPDRVPTIGG